MANFINPFESGVSYKDFLKSIPKGKTIKTHLKGKLTNEEIEWIESEIKNYKNN